MLRSKQILLSISLVSITLFILHSYDKSKRIIQEEIPSSTPETTPGVDIPCEDIIPKTDYELRGDFWVLPNYFLAARRFHCDQSITYTTHADFTFLDNLVPLLERWQGPLSLSLYCPSTDFNETVKRILYLRECSDSSLVKNLVSFHLFFDGMYIPNYIPSPFDPSEFKIVCSIDNPMVGNDSVVTFKKANNLTYPVNMGRMIARDFATTFYVLPSDIELYPSPNLISNFLDMIRRHDQIINSSNPKVFVLPIFEADEKITRLPYNKSELIQLLKIKSVIPFHKYVCPECHKVPLGEEWLNSSIEEGMHVFHVAKRLGRYRHWEPIFIGTKSEPPYDTRLNWEGRRDKMTQGHILCVLDYEFHILDNAFLIHRPGIKRITKRTHLQNVAGAKQNRLINSQIYPEINKLYGSRNGCSF